MLNAFLIMDRKDGNSEELGLFEFAHLPRRKDEIVIRDASTGGPRYLEVRWVRHFTYGEERTVLFCRSSRLDMY